MGQPITERYSPIPVGVTSTVNFSGNAIGGFIAYVAGTLTIVANAADGKPSATYTPLVVTAGWNKIPMYIGANGGSVTTIGTATGILLVV